MLSNCRVYYNVSCIRNNHINFLTKLYKSISAFISVSQYIVSNDLSYSNFAQILALRFPNTIFIYISFPGFRLSFFLLSRNIFLLLSPLHLLLCHRLRLLCAVYSCRSTISEICTKFITDLFNNLE